MCNNEVIEMNEEKIALSAQRVMERIFDGDYGDTIIAPLGMELWRYGFRKTGKAGKYQRWIRKEADNKRKRKTIAQS